MMARFSKLLLLMALTVVAVEARRNVSIPFHRSMHHDCCGNRPSDLSQQQQQQWQLQQQREARAAIAHQNNWDEFMSEIYGANWADEESSQHLDAARCMQWAVYKEDVLKDENYPNANDEELGHRGCMSALVREAVMGSLDKLDKEAVEWKEQVKKYSVLQLGHATDHSSKEDISVEVRTWKPLLCEAIAQESKKDCQVRIYAVDEFAKLRKSSAMPNRRGPLDFTDKIAKSIQSGPLWFFKPGAGKSFYSAFSSTWDNNFKLKIGIRHDTWMNEPKRLLSMVVGTKKAKSLVQHLEGNTHSLLNRYLSMVRVKVLGEEKYVLLMADATHGEDARIATLKKKGSRLLYTRYDLKGASRDQDEKSKPANQFTLINGDFKAKEKNNLDLTKDQCQVLRQAVREDTVFLDSHKLIDYSLFVGVTNGEAVGCSTTAGEPFCFEATKSLTYTFSIVDYINHKNFAKGVENFWHGGKFDDYGKGIDKFIGEICPGRLEWYERTAFRIWCVLIVFVLAMVAGGLGFWYWQKLQGSYGSPAKQQVQQVPWQQGPAPPTPQYSVGDDFGIASGKPQGYVRQHGMGGSPVTGGGFA